MADNLYSNPMYNDEYRKKQSAGMTAVASLPMTNQNNPNEITPLTNESMSGQAVNPNQLKTQSVAFTGSRPQKTFPQPQQDTSVAFTGSGPQKTFPQPQQNTSVAFTGDRPQTTPAQNVTKDMNTAVLEKAQTDVLNQPGTSSLQDLYTQKATDFLNKPMGDYDPAKYKQQRLEKAGSDYANTFEALRRQYGNISGSGLLQKSMLENQLQNNIDMGQLESNLDKENYDRYVDSMIKSIETGKGVNLQNEDAFTQRLKNLELVRGMAEGERSQTSGQEFTSTENALDRAFKLQYLAQDQAGQEAITKLQGQIKKGMLLDEQNFAEAQAALNRAHDLAVQQGDIAGQKEIETLRGQIQAQAQQAQNDFIAIQNSLDRDGQIALTNLKGSLDKDMLLSQQDFQSTQNALDRAIQEAKMQGDWENAENLTILKGQIDAQAQEKQQEFLAIQNSLDRENQMALTQLKGDIDMGMLIEQNKFNEIQNSLDRDLERYKAAGDWENAEKITMLKGQIDSQMQKSQQDWATAERLGEQSWKTSENISQQQFAQASQLLEQKHQLAIQNNDITAQKDIEQKKAELALTMQLQGFTHDEKMSNLDAQLKEAAAQNDFARQKQLMQYQSSIKLSEMEKEFGYTQALEKFKGEIDKELQNNNHVNAMAMLDAQQKFAEDQAAKDREIEWAKVKMQEKGLDMQKFQQEFENIKAVNGDDAAFDYLQNELKKQGITMTKQEKDSIAQELAADYKKQQIIFALSNPQYAEKDANGNVIGLKPDGATLFNNFLNESYYGEDGKISVGGEKISNQYKSSGASYDMTTQKLYYNGKPAEPAQYEKILRNADDPKNQNYQVYQKLLSTSISPNIEISSSSSNEISGVPKEGEVLNINGRLMVITRGLYREHEGRNKDAFEIMDVATGAKKTFNGLSQDDNSVKNLGSWATEIGAL